MKIHALSDLHFEHRTRGQVEEFFEKLEAISNKEITCVLAGDIFTIAGQEERFKNLINRICGLYKYVVYLPGNHEFYGSSIKRCSEKILAIANESKNLQVLLPCLHQVLDEQKFVGGTMWFPEPWDPITISNKKYLSDFKLIHPIDSIYKEHRAFIKEIPSRIDKDTVVVSHHLPFEECINSKYKNDPLNPFFMYDMEPHLTVWPKLWIHGHTHSPVDFVKNGTRVYCNPLGYPREDGNPEFWNRIEIEVQ